VPDPVASAPSAPTIDHPNLLLAVGRLRRLQVAWAILFAGLGGLALASGGLTQPMVPLTWIIIAVLLLSRPEPLFLALVSAAWGLSMIFLVPGARLVLGGDPISRIFATDVAETLAMAVVRLVLLIAAWNQFLFYRLLYGTEGAAGLDPSLAPVPPVLPNSSDGTAILARLAGFVAVMASLASVPLADSAAGALLLGLSYGGTTLAVGLGLGSAFVPTQRRSIALWGVALGCAGLVLALLIGRALYPASGG